MLSCAVAVLVPQRVIDAAPASQIDLARDASVCMVVVYSSDWNTPGEQPEAAGAR